MTREEATHLFMTKSLIPEDAARMEVIRGTVNPMYLNYTLGKLLILKLREDYKKEKGDSFSLKEFHDEFMFYGGAPVSLIRKFMLKSNKDELL